MPEFGSPFSGVSSERKLSHAELVNAIPDRQRVLGSGSTIGPALNFGYIAGLNAAAETYKLP